jgi:hypothetical protein
LKGGEFDGNKEKGSKEDRKKEKEISFPHSHTHISLGWRRNSPAPLFWNYMMFN